MPADFSGYRNEEQWLAVSYLLTDSLYMVYLEKFIIVFRGIAPKLITGHCIYVIPIRSRCAPALWYPSQEGSRPAFPD